VFFEGIAYSKKMTLAKRDLVNRIREETGVTQSLMFDVVQYALVTSPSRWLMVARQNSVTSACSR
jgi:hypothetical protein